jgi:hypothetical protein
MRLTSLAIGLSAMLGGAALAAEGDDLVVTGDGVNLRARPQAGAPVLLQVYQGEPAVEVAREGDWVRVRLPKHEVVGWMHGSLLAAAGGQPLAAPAQPAVPVQPGATVERAPAPAPAPEPPAVQGGGETPPAGGGAELAVTGAPGSEAAIASFRDTVTYLNERALAAAGIELFTDVRADPASGVAQVIATDAWNVVPDGGQRSYLNTLLDRWSAAVGSGRQARVEIVDDSGRLLGERSTP